MKQNGNNNNSILVLSEEQDFSTNIVLKWIWYFGIPFIRINEEDNIEIKNIEIHEGKTTFSFIKDGQEIKSEDLISFWYRRGGIRFNVNKHIKSLIKDTLFSKEFEKLYKRLHTENKRIEHFLYGFLENLKSIGSEKTAVNNKLLHLSIASKFGLKIPETHVLSKKSELVTLLNSSPNGVICKPISDVTSLDFVNEDIFKIYHVYTNMIKSENLKDIPDSFFPSLFQKYIKKRIELRIFYLNGDFYSMGIFSQKDKKTEVDFRKYNFQKPNKTTIIDLPYDIKKKISLFMNSIGLNTGSIDMIYSSEKEFVFLEINPVGQFGMVSTPCNFYLEKKIATYLISK